MSYNGGMAEKLYRFFRSGTLGKGVMPKDVPRDKAGTVDKKPEDLKTKEAIQELLIGKKSQSLKSDNNHF